MDSKKSFKLLVVSNTTPFFVVVQIIYFHDCSTNSTKRGKVGFTLDNIKRKRGGGGGWHQFFFFFFFWGGGGGGCSWKRGGYPYFLVGLWNPGWNYGVLYITDSSCKRKFPETAYFRGSTEERYCLYCAIITAIFLLCTEWKVDWDFNIRISYSIFYKWKYDCKMKYIFKSNTTYNTFNIFMLFIIFLYFHILNFWPGLTKLF